MWQSEDSYFRFASNRELQWLVEKNRILANDVALVQFLEDGLLVLGVFYKYFNLPFNYEEDIVAHFSLVEDKRLRLQKFVEHGVRHLIEGLNLLLLGELKVVDLLEQKDLEFLPHIVVVERLVSHFYKNFRKYSAQVKENGLAQAGHCAIIVALHGRCSQRGPYD